MPESGGDVNADMRTYWDVYNEHRIGNTLAAIGIVILYKLVDELGGHKIDNAWHQAKDKAHEGLAGIAQYTRQLRRIHND